MLARILVKKTLLTACLTLTATLNAYAHVGPLQTDKKHDCELFEAFKKKKKEEKIVIVDPNKTEEKFKRITTRVAALYSGTIRDRVTGIDGGGGEFRIVHDWKSDVVNAYAQKGMNFWEVNFTGGLYRDPNVTDDGLALTACHEVGHLIGGAPYKNGTNGQLSIEGQADFWASAVCIKRYFKEFPETVYMQEGYPKYACDIQYYGDQEATNICYRSFLAGEGMAKMLASAGGTEAPDLESQNRTNLSYTSQFHPEAQCRLDTYSQGALCQLDDTSFNFDDKTDKSKLTTDFLCNERSNGVETKFEKRPKCWFNEKMNNIYANTDMKVISQKYRTLIKNKSITILYFNHLPGEYKIRLIPMDEITKESIVITNPEYKVNLPASGDTKNDFMYSFTKKTNAKLKILVEVTYEGQVISAKDDFLEINAKSFLAF
jgi:hypothetical protein